jgi:hypothetical protein
MRRGDGGPLQLQRIHKFHIFVRRFHERRELVRAIVGNERGCIDRIAILVEKVFNGTWRSLCGRPSGSVS